MTWECIIPEKAIEDVKKDKNAQKLADMISKMEGEPL